MLATNLGIIGGGMHLAMHAFGKITLFYCAGAILIAAHKTEVSQLDGIGRAMPYTMAAFAIGSLSMIGLPPTAGFISKWYLVLAALDAGAHLIAFMILASSLLAVVYVWRVVEVMYFQGEDSGEDSPGDPPMSMLIPTWVLIGATVWFGFTTELTAGTAAEAAKMLLEVVK